GDIGHGRVREFRSTMAGNAAALGLEEQESMQLSLRERNGANRVTDVDGISSGRGYVKLDRHRSRLIVDSSAGDPYAAHLPGAIVKPEHLLVARIQGGVQFHNRYGHGINAGG